MRVRRVTLGKHSLCDVIAPTLLFHLVCSKSTPLPTVLSLSSWSVGGIAGSYHLPSSLLLYRAPLQVDVNAFCNWHHATHGGHWGWGLSTLHCDAHGM